jgi:stage V sporulation protein T
MKGTGIVRRVDDLGRIVIPREIRRTLNICEGEPLEIFIDDDGSVTFKKFSPLVEEEEETEDKYTLDDLGNNWY